MLLALLLSLTQHAASPCSPTGPIFCSGGNMSTGSTPPPLLSFADATGVGMGTACACTSVTGTKGEALTFTRASSGTCLKTTGASPQGIANGDMVTCTSNQPRAMAGADATTQLGVLFENARTNAALQSEHLENAAWVKASSGVAAPIVTADQAIGPDGNLTADRVQFAATTGAQFSVIDQTVASTLAFAGTAFLRGNSSSGALDVDCQNGAADTCKTCSFVAGTWTRCDCEATGSASQLLIIGNYPACSAGSRAAADVFMWGGDIEAGAYPTSYIATTTVAVTRAYDVLALGDLTPILVTGSSSLSAQVSAAQGFLLNFAAGTSRPIYLPSGGTVRVFDGVNTADDPHFATGVSQHVYSFWNGVSMTVGNATQVTSVSGLFNGTMLHGAGSTMYLGNLDTGGIAPDGVLKSVCLDSTSTRCR